MLFSIEGSTKILVDYFNEILIDRLDVAYLFMSGTMVQKTSNRKDRKDMKQYIQIAPW